MKNEPSSTPLPKQMRWRVSEQVAARMTYVRRETGHKSWDDFFSALMDRWSGAQPTSRSSVIETQLKALDARLDGIQSQLGFCRTYIESQAETFQDFGATQEQTLSQMQRFVGLLELGLLLDREETPEPSSIQKSTAMPQAGSEILRKIRNRQV